MSGKTAWDQGYDAARAGLNESDNPYDRKTQYALFSQWRSGYYDVMYANPEDNYCGGY